ncbi:MAG: hypothetical protein AABY16_03035 [Nanoarchaeota archaeon]
MKAEGILVFLAGSLALVILGTGLALACPSPLECANFTQSDKIADCNFVNSQALSYEDQQNVLCGLWDEDYGYNVYQSTLYLPLQPSIALQADPISNTRFLLAGKITVFLLFNYFLFSLTKSAYFKKCLPALSQT